MLFLSACSHLPRQRIDHSRLEFGRDTFSFANETVFAYKDGETVSNDEIERDENAERYTRGCFVMSRAVVQFWKYAHFAPDEPAVSNAELARRVDAVAHRAPWGEPLPPPQRVTFPGFTDLNHLSRQRTRLLQDHLGSGLATYFRVGNWSIPFVPNERHQIRTHELIDRWLAAGYPVIVWLHNFPHITINHVIVVLDRTETDGRIGYSVYDPNFTDRPRRLEYDPTTAEFSYEKTFYFTGGRCGVRIIYQDVLH